MYTLTEKRTVIDGREYLVYGVKYDDKFYADNISTDKNIVENLTCEFNRCELSPIHLYDVIEDFLAQI